MPLSVQVTLASGTFCSFRPDQFNQAFTRNRTSSICCQKGEDSAIFPTRQREDICLRVCHRERTNQTNFQWFILVIRLFLHFFDVCTCQQFTPAQ